MNNKFKIKACYFNNKFSGQTPLKGVTLTDFLPIGSIFVSASEGGVLMVDISVIKIGKPWNFKN